MLELIEIELKLRLLLVRTSIRVRKYFEAFAVRADSSLMLFNDFVNYNCER